MNGWVFLTTLAILGLGVGAILVLARKAAPRTRAVLFVISAPVVFVGAALAAWIAERVEWSEPTPVPQQVAEGEYIGSDACLKCHERQHESWRGSFHRTMTQLANSETVVGDFDGVERTLKGQTCSMVRRAGEYWVTMPDPDWEFRALREGRDPSRYEQPPLVEKQVKLITGSHHMQVYWVESGELNGLVQAPWYWLIDEQKWIPGIYSSLDAYADEYPGIQTHAVWNDLCIKCHSVAGKPHADEATGAFASEVVEFGIACEACHGPGREHAEARQNAAKAIKTRGSRADIVNPASTSPKISSQICGQCHSGFVLVDPESFRRDGIGFRPGTDLSNTHIVFRYSDPRLSEIWERAPQSFWRDGTCRVGGDEYNGMIESPCYANGPMSCLSCHSMHDYDKPSDQLAAKMNGDEACLQCHEQFRDDPSSHTHHAAESSGSRCYNCHQPHTSYALFKAIRSHRIDSPDVTRSVQSGRPNACNLCHLDKTLAWSGEHLQEWYGNTPPDLSDEQKTTSAALLWMLKGDAIQRTIAVWHAGWPAAQKASGDDWSAPFVARLLEDPYAATRFVAHRSLRTLPGFSEFEFDFAQAERGRKDARRRAVELWEQRGAAPQAERDFHHLLLDERGEVQTARVERLLRLRDETPITIDE